MNIMMIRLHGNLVVITSSNYAYSGEYKWKLTFMRHSPWASTIYTDRPKHTSKNVLLGPGLSSYEHFHKTENPEAHRMDGWMDDLQFHFLFSIIMSVVSG